MNHHCCWLLKFRAHLIFKIMTDNRLIETHLSSDISPAHSAAGHAMNIFMMNPTRAMQLLMQTKLIARLAVIFILDTTNPLTMGPRDHDTMAIQPAMWHPWVVSIKASKGEDLVLREVWKSLTSVNASHWCSNMKLHFKVLGYESAVSADIDIETHTQQYCNNEWILQHTHNGPWQVWNEQMDRIEMYLW